MLDEHHVRYVQPNITRKWSITQCQRLLYSWTWVSTVSCATRPHKHGGSHHANMVFQHIDPLTSEELQNLKLSTNTNVTQLDRLASEAKDHLYRDINKMLELHGNHIRDQSIHYTAWYIAVPSIFTILFTIIICYGKPKLYRRLSNMITRSKKCNNPIQRDSPHPNSENPNIPLAEATSL
jgi:hypothetical protein